MQVLVSQPHLTRALFQAQILLGMVRLPAQQPQGGGGAGSHGGAPLAQQQQPPPQGQFQGSKVLIKSQRLDLCCNRASRLNRAKNKESFVMIMFLVICLTNRGSMKRSTSKFPNASLAQNLS